jgi:hypothetical protein
MLVSLFTKTRGRCLYPKPPILHQRRHHTYTGIVLGSVDQGGALASNNHHGFGQHRYQSVAPHGTGQPDVFVAEREDQTDSNIVGGDLVGHCNTLIFVKE